MTTFLRDVAQEYPKSRRNQPEQLMDESCNPGQKNKSIRPALDSVSPIGSSNDQQVLRSLITIVALSKAQNMNPS